jgi:general stress protein 13
MGRGAIMEEFKVGNIVSCVVTGIKNYGIFVKLENDYRGLIHISKISEKFVKNVEDYANIGETIYAEIESIDHENKHCVLSVKNMNYRIDENPLIHETISGFSSLKKKLPEWIEEKKEEYKEVK